MAPINLFFPQYKKKINMLFKELDRSVWEKTVPLVLSTALGPRETVYSRPRERLFPMQTSRPVNNIYALNSFLVPATTVSHFFFLTDSSIARLPVAKPKKDQKLEGWLERLDARDSLGKKPRLFNQNKY